MNAKRFITLTLILTLLLCVKFAMGASYIVEPFSAHMKRAELIFIGTLVEKEIIHEGATGLHTDLTFRVDELIEGVPNIDNDTVKFRVPGRVDRSGASSPGQTYRNLEVGETLMMLMHVNEHRAVRYGWLYPISPNHGSWFVTPKKVNDETEYTVYIWATDKATLKRHYLGLPLPLMVRFIDAARKHPETMDPVADVIGYALSKGSDGAIKPDTPETAQIRKGIITYIKIALEGLETEDIQKTAIDVQRLAGATPETADQLLRKMLPCKLRHENRWQEGQSDGRDIMGKLFNRVYEIENGRIDRWGRKPEVALKFDPDYEERVYQIDVSFTEFVSHIDALERLGYDPEAGIEHLKSENAWYFITREYLHQVHWEDTGQQSVRVTIHLDALTQEF